MAQVPSGQKIRLNELMDEFQKESPDQQKIKHLFTEFGLNYSKDPLDQMMLVLSKSFNLSDEEEIDKESGNYEPNI